MPKFRKATTPLSRHLPTAIRQAVADLRVVAKDPRVRVDFSKWCYVDGDVCRVCVAGATILRGRCGVDVHFGSAREYVGSTCQRDISNTLSAINLVRNGEVMRGVERVGGRLRCSPPEDITRPLWLEDLEHDLQEMLRRADWIEKHADLPLGRNSHGLVTATESTCELSQVRGVLMRRRKHWWKRMNWDFARHALKTCGIRRPVAFLLTGKRWRRIKMADDLFFGRNRLPEVTRNF